MGLAFEVPHVQCSDHLECPAGSRNIKTRAQDRAIMEISHSSQQRHEINCRPSEMLMRGL
jgi:hypothetical protein